MNKSDLIARVADATGMAKEQAEKAINATIATIKTHWRRESR